MATPDQLAQRLLQVVKAIAEHADALKEQFDALLTDFDPANIAERIERAVSDGVKRGQDQLQGAVDAAKVTVSNAKDALDTARQRLESETAAAEDALEEQRRRADGLVEAAERARDQALAMIEAASDAAVANRERADAALDAAEKEAQKLRDDAKAAFDKTCHQLKTAVENALGEFNAAEAAADRALQDLTDGVAQLKERLQAEFDQRIRQAAELKEQFDDLVEAPDEQQLKQRLDDAVSDGVRRARERLQGAVEAANVALSTAEGVVVTATQRLESEKAAAQEVLDEQRRLADKRIADAEHAHQQALAGIDAASDTASAERQRADDALRTATLDAQMFREKAQAAFQEATQLLQAAVDEAMNARDLGMAAAAAAEAKANVAADQLKAQVEAEVAQRFGQVTLGDVEFGHVELGEVESLADDARARLTQALDFPAGVLSLTAQALCWLKDEFFAQEDRLQVVRFTPAADTHGLGLTWTDAGATLLVAYASDHPTEKGSLTVKLDGGVAGEPVQFDAPGIIVKVTGAGDQEIVIGPGATAPAAGTGDLTITVTFTALDWAWRGAMLEADTGSPKVTLDLHHDGSWHYSLAVEIPSYGVTIRPSAMLVEAGIPLPLPVPDLTERRAARIALEDGTLVFREGTAA